LAKKLKPPAKSTAIPLAKMYRFLWTKIAS